VKSLSEIEAAIAQLPSKAQRQLIKDIPTLCPRVFPADGWDAILAEATPRPALSSLLDRLDAEYQQRSEKFLAVNESSLRKRRS
jgi:hypothetical protein